MRGEEDDDPGDVLRIGKSPHNICPNGHGLSRSAVLTDPGRTQLTRIAGPGCRALRAATQLIITTAALLPLLATVPGFDFDL